MLNAGGALEGLVYDQRGAGPPILLIHGHPFDRRMWWPQMSALPAELRVVAVDLPGYGESPPVGTTVTMRELAERVMRLGDALGLGACTVVGLSMGGLVAMEIALAGWHRLSGIVLAATTAAPVNELEARTRHEQAATIERCGMLDATLAMAPRLFGSAAKQDPDLIAFVLDMMLHAPPAGAAAALRGRAMRPPYAELLRGIAVPALVIAGDSDGFAPEEVVAELIEALPEPEVLRLPGVGHLPNLEAPEAFNAALRRFVTGIPA
jgi:pimeloyl-ACP methyl ester carboxylesterase